MSRRQLEIIQRICLIVIATLVVGVNFVNYYLEDDRGQMYRNVFLAISWIMFLSMIYIWVGEFIRRNKLTTILSGWCALYLMINLIVVLLGWNLYTHGVIEMFWITVLAGTAHIGVKLWKF